jgi:hypothetical protein
MIRLSKKSQRGILKKEKKRKSYDLRIVEEKNSTFA